MMRCVKSVLIGLALLLEVGVVQAGVYHITSGGSDAAAGSSTSPWRTLGKANSTLVAGDVVIVHGGTYSDGISPTRTGVAGSPITYQVASGEQVVLNVTTGIKLGSASRYITVDGFEIRASYRVVELVGSSYITIRNCLMYGGRGNYSGFSLEGASYCVIQNNYYNRQDPDGSSVSGNNPTGGDGLRLIGNSNHNLIEGNTVTRCEHVGFASSFSKADVYQSYNIWRNNTSYNNHTNFSLQDGVVRCVFENNTGYYMGMVWTGGNGWCLQFTGTDCILRFNTLYDDTGTVYINRQWPGTVGTMTGSANGSTPSLLYNKVYNNTIYGETDQKGWLKDGWRWENFRTGLTQNENRFKNNIVAAAGANQINDIDAAHSLASMNNRYEANLLFAANGQPAKIRYEYSGGNSAWDLAGAKRAKPDQWASTNIEGNPLFANPRGEGPAKDFTLLSGSPAIDAAVHLTTASSAGTGTTLVVADAGYFTDGWGIPGVEGDSIKIESEAPVGIVKVDYATNQVTLNSARTWSAGARIFYYRSDRFRGTAPDIGAHEFGGGTMPGGGPPQLNAPGNGSSESPSSTVLSWAGVMGATSYTVQVANDSAFSNLVTNQGSVRALSFSPTGLKAGMVYHWRVASVSVDGRIVWSEYRKFNTYVTTDASDERVSVPEVFRLEQNYPNPFNPSTQIRYSLAKAGQVSLKVFNVLGQEVITLVNEEQPAGSYQVRFDATSLPNGTYFCRMHTAAFDKTTKMLLVK